MSFNTLIILNVLLLAWMKFIVTRNNISTILIEITALNFSNMTLVRKKYFPVRVTAVRIVELCIFYISKQG